MKAAGKVLVSGVAAVALATLAARAAPLVFGDVAMAQFRTTRGLVLPGQNDIAASLPVELAVRSSVPPVGLAPGAATVAVTAPFRPTARPGHVFRRTGRMGGGNDRATGRGIVALRLDPVARPAGAACCRTATLARTLSDGEADQVTAAGFLFPVAAAIGAQTILARPSMVRPSTVLSPSARMNNVMSKVVVVRRPPTSMIVHISRL